MKPTKRLQFSFLRSYFDVLNEIPEDKDKLDFLISIINKQFLNEDPKELSFVAKLSYESQRHSIEKSVKGYMDRMNTDLQGNPINTNKTTPAEHPPQGGCEHPAEHPPQQEKEKEKEKEKYNTIPPKGEKQKIDFDKLLGFINLKTKRSFRIINDKVKKKYKARLKEGYTSKDIANAIENACNRQNHKENNYQYLTPEFFSRADILDKYGASTEKDIKKEKSNRTVENPYETIYGNK